MKRRMTLVFSLCWLFVKAWRWLCWVMRPTKNRQWSVFAGSTLIEISHTQEAAEFEAYKWNHSPYKKAVRDSLGKATVRRTY